MEQQEAQATLEWLKKVKDPLILLQANVEAPLGQYRGNGVADVIRLHQNRRGELDVFIADIKASRKERMEHRLQVATYAYLLRSMAEANDIAIGTMRGGVLHIQEDGSIPTLDPETPSFDLDTYLDILRRLAIDDDELQGLRQQVLGRDCGDAGEGIAIGKAEQAPVLGVFDHRLELAFVLDDQRVIPERFVRAASFRDRQV